LEGLPKPKIEPSAEVSGVCVDGPAVERQLDDLLLNVDKADVCEPLFGEIAVHAQGAAEAIHGIEKLIRPLHNRGIRGERTVVAPWVPVYLDLLEIAVMRFEMSWGRLTMRTQPVS
jgi:hypothetical protein